MKNIKLCLSPADKKSKRDNQPIPLARISKNFYLPSLAQKEQQPIKYNAVNPAPIETIRADQYFEILSCPLSPAAPQPIIAIKPKNTSVVAPTREEKEQHSG